MSGLCYKSKYSRAIINILGGESMCMGVCKDINIVMVDKQPRYIELLTDARRFSKPVA